MVHFGPDREHLTFKVKIHSENLLDQSGGSAHADRKQIKSNSRYFAIVIAALHKILLKLFDIYDVTREPKNKCKKRY